LKLNNTCKSRPSQTFATMPHTGQQSLAEVEHCRDYHAGKRGAIPRGGRLSSMAAASRCLRWESLTSTGFPALLFGPYFGSTAQGARRMAMSRRPTDLRA